VSWQEILGPLQAGTAHLGWLDWAQLAGLGFVCWLYGHIITRGQLRQG